VVDACIAQQSAKTAPHYAGYFFIAQLSWAKPRSAWLLDSENPAGF